MAAITRNGVVGPYPRVSRCTGATLTLRNSARSCASSRRWGGTSEWMLGGFYTREGVTDRQSTNAFDNGYHPIAAFAPSISFSTHTLDF